MGPLNREVPLRALFPSPSSAVATALLAPALLAAALVGCKSESSGGSGSTSAEGPAAGSEIEASLTFLRAVAKLNHKDEADAAWAELEQLSGKKVPVKLGDL
jgi:hypothetical protein